ncbi:acyl-CoA thioesterase/bile acid-CoA:amino acid N-acyltransferase family protein [Variovorax sp. GB1P17]|uniref:acyl-CoA thioesterase/bile acid-CoA:amino acid N-acyltransferase family protein n=1 Tax=Variovorax sp. GB1P17 TaxID=3443740 RepID=UPI003F446B33
MQLDPLPSDCLVDHTLVIRVRGLSAGALLTARLYSAGYDGSVYLSQATFAADADGVVDLSRQAPVSESYQGVDAMGLFWSRALASGPAAAACGDASKDPFTVTLKLTSDDTAESIAHTIKRTFTTADVSSRDVREDGLVGRMFEPAHSHFRGAVLVVGGSGGGLAWSQEVASLLSSHGYAAFALAYFAAEGLPPMLDRIPLEYFGTALTWLAAQPGVAAGPIAVVGASRGGELALLLGATFPAVRAVVAYVPSGVVWGAYPASGHGAWTLEGQEIAYANDDEWEKTPRDAAYLERVSIPVEKIGGPVLMISGADDKMWPSSELAEIAFQRLKHAAFPHRFEHLSYPGAGHHIGWPNVFTTMTKFKHPTSGEDLDMGGTPQSTAHARQDSWTRMLEFLRAALAGG